METYPIAAVARDTGVNKDTLRVWERRYGFPTPSRDAQGERSYSAQDVERLRVVKRLMDAGHRPGRLMAMSPEARQALAEGVAPAPSSGAADAMPPSAADMTALAGCLELIRALDAAGLRRHLGHDLASRGLTRFLVDVLAPLSVAVGEAWMRGELAVYEEHMFTRCAQGVLDQALAGLPEPARDARPRVLLATLPGEPHGLGLQMAELALALEGARCLSLGVQTPLADIGQAALAFRADVVALSISGCTSPRGTLADLRELRGRLRPAQALWVGGRAPAVRRRPVDGVLTIDGLEALPRELARWRRSPLSPGPA